MGSLLLQHKRSAKSLVSIQVMGLGTGARESGKDFCHWKMMLEMMAMVMQVMMIRGLFVPGEAGGPPAIPSAPLAQLLTHSLGRGSCLAQPVSPLLHSVQAASRRCFLSGLVIHSHTHRHTDRHTDTHAHVGAKCSAAAGNPVHPVRCVRWAVVQGCWRSGSGSHVAAGVSPSFKDLVYQAQR